MKNKNTLKRTLSTIGLYALLALNSQPALAESNYISIADIHFNPFASCHQETAPCPIIEKLQKAPAEKWKAILAANDKELPAFKQDTNYALLQSTLAQLKKTAEAKHANFVVVLGDFLGHGYEKYFDHYARDKSITAYQSFVKKTLTFLTSELNATFPTTDVYIAAGNNDSYLGDYDVVINGVFFRDLATLGSNLIKNQANKATMQQDFKVGGYYAVDIPQQPNLKLIVLNSVLFYTNAKGAQLNSAAQTQLDWLQDQLEQAAINQQQAIIAMHVPPGIDAFNSLQQKPFQIIELYHPAYSRRLIDILDQYSNQVRILLAAHFHSDNFAIVRLKSGNLPLSFTPSVSPLFGNNPAYKVYNDTNMQTYRYTLDGDKEWQLEYDFNAIYQPDCQNCTLLNGMLNLKPDNELAEKYKQFFSAGTNSQPIRANWAPYWCQTQTIIAAEYQACISEMSHTATLHPRD